MKSVATFRMLIWLKSYLAFATFQSLDTFAAAAIAIFAEAFLLVSLKKGNESENEELQSV